MLEENRFEYPILGRDEEMELFIQEIRNIIARPEASQREAIIFFGEAGVGKSRLLEAAVMEVMKKGIKYVVVKMFTCMYMHAHRQTDTPTDRYTQTHTLRKWFSHGLHKSL